MMWPPEIVSVRKRLDPSAKLYLAEASPEIMHLIPLTGSFLEAIVSPAEYHVNLSCVFSRKADTCSLLTPLNKGKFMIVSYIVAIGK